ncbi:thermonuclease family protein [Caulobacter sp. LARHSG274]
MTKTVLTILSLSAALLAGCQRTPDPPASVNVPPGLGDRVRVLSADAMVVDGRHVRLANAYAPQGVPDARCWAEATAALLAVDKVRDRVKDARTISVGPASGFDEYHRELATVSLDGVDLGQELYSQGLAARRTSAPNGRFSWCDPISGKAQGGPPVSALLDSGVQH